MHFKTHGLKARPLDCLCRGFTCKSWVCKSGMCLETCLKPQGPRNPTWKSSFWGTWT